MMASAPVLGALLGGSAANGAAIASVADGQYVDLPTWPASPGRVPTVGDTAVVDHKVVMDDGTDGDETWDADVVQINSSGELDARGGMATVNALVFNGGILNSSNNDGTIFAATVAVNDVAGNHYFTAKNKRNTTLTTVTLTGSGTLEIQPNRDKTVTLTIGDATGFTGLLDVAHVDSGGDIGQSDPTVTGFLELTNGITEGDASFGIQLNKVIYDWADGPDPDDGIAYSAYDLSDENVEVWVTSLTIDGFSIPARATAYTYAELAAMNGGAVANYLKTDGADGTLGVVDWGGTPAGIVITDIVHNGASVDLTWTTSGLPAGGVDIYRSTDLVDWGTAIDTGNTGTTYTDNSPPDPTAFYVLVPTDETTNVGFPLTVTVTRIDARPPGHPLDSGIESDPIIDLPFMQAAGAAGSSATKVQLTGPAVIRVPDWIPDSEKTHPDAVYYMYYAAHGSDDISLAWAESITGEWHLFNRGDASNRAWGVNGNYTGTETPGAGVLDLDLGEDGVIWIDEDFGVDDHIASPDVLVDDVNERIILYFHGPMHKIILRSGTGNFVATSKWGLNFNMPEEGGEQGQGPRNVLPAAQYLKTFEVEGEYDGKTVIRTFGFVNGAPLWAAPLLTSAGDPASHANADEDGGYFTPSWSGDPTPLEHPYDPGQKPYWWTEYDSWTNANPLDGVIKAPELVPPDNDYIVREKNQDPRHFGIYHNNELDRDKIYVFYTCRRDLPESIVLVTLDLTGLTETERLDPSLWGRVNDVEQVMLKPELVWEGVEEHPYKHSASGGGHGYQFRDPDVFQDIDGKVYLFYCGKGEGAIGVAEVTFATESTEKSLSITSPFRGYTCLIGWERNISWKTTGDIASVDLEYTINGTDWMEIATGVENKDYYTWTTPNAPSDIAQVRVTETGGSTVSVCDPFFIAVEETLFMVRPSAGTSVPRGSVYGLNWAEVGEIELVDLEYTLNGTDWISIANSVENPGTFAWTVPDIETNDVRIRISETNGSLESISDPFSIGSP